MSHMPQAFVRHLVAIGVPDEDIPQVGKSVGLITGCLTPLGYRQPLPQLATLQPGIDLKVKLWEWARTVATDDIAILYFAGHGGTVRGRHYLGLPNTNWDSPEVTALASEDLFRALAGGTPLMRLLVILDTCYSGQAGLDIQGIASSLQGSTLDRTFWLIAASRPKQEAGDGDFAAAFHDLVLGQHGAAVRRLELPTLVEDLKPKLRDFQRPVWTVMGLASGEPPDFLPNPNFIAEGLLERPVEDRLFYRDDLQKHWKPEAIGSAAIFQSGQWYFTGRAAALRHTIDWLSPKNTGGKGLAVTGDPGSGKSALLGYLVIASNPLEAKQPELEQFLASMPEGTRPSPGCITFALALRGKTLQEAKDALATRFNAKPEDVLASLVNRDERTVLVFDALDESAAPAEIADKFLRPLTGYAHLRVIVGTRRPDAKYLGALFEQLDLDLPAYRSDADVALYVRRLLLAEGEKRATPYHGQQAAAQTVADAVAAQANGNYLVARTIARALMERDAVIDLTHEHIPQSIPEAFSQYLKRLGERSNLGEWRVRELLMPLAYAKGQGLPLTVWELCIGTSTAQILDLAAAFIGEYAEDGRTVYRLYHQALADALHDPQRNAGREQKMAQALYAALPEKDWLRADWYTRKYVAVHAAAGDPELLERLVLDVKFLVCANTPRLLTVSHAIQTAEPKRRLNWLKLASDRLNEGDESERLAHLELVAIQNGAADLAAECRQVGLRQKWRPKWARWSHSSTPHRVLRGHEEAVNSVALAGGIAVSGSDDHTVRFWDVATGQPIGEVARHENKVMSVAAYAGVAISGGWDDTVRLWDLHTGKPKGEPLLAHRSTVLAVAIGDGFAASGGDDRTVVLWDTEAARMIGEPLRGHTGPVRALAIYGNIVISGSEDGSIRVWDRSGRPYLAPLQGPWKKVTALAVREGILTALGDENIVQSWELSSGRVLSEPLRLKGIFNTIDITDDVMVCGSGGADFNLRVFDFYTGQQKGPPLAGHTLFVRSVAIAGGVMVSGADDNTVRIWNLTSSEPLGPVGSDLESGCAAVAISGSVVVTGDWDKRARIWCLETGESRGKTEPLLHREMPIAVGDGVMACNGEREGIWIVDWETLIAKRLSESTEEVRLLGISEGVLVSIASGSNRSADTLRRWDLKTLTPLGGPISVGSYVNAIAIRDDVIWAGGSTLLRWNLLTGESLGNPLPGGLGIAALAVNKNVAVSGHWDGTLRVWDADKGDALRESRGAPWSRLACLALYKGFAVSGSPDETVTIWNLTTLEPLFKIRLGSSVNGLAASEDGICVACAAGLVYLELNL